MDNIRAAFQGVKQRAIDLLQTAGEHVKDVPDAPTNKTYFEPQAAVVPFKSTEARNELIIKLIGTLASLGLSVFAIRYMMNALDPTNKEKKKARDRVRLKLLYQGQSKKKSNMYIINTFFSYYQKKDNSQFSFVYYLTKSFFS